jgi:hypothetical protein
MSPISDTRRRPSSHVCPLVMISHLWVPFVVEKPKVSGRSVGNGQETQPSSKRGSQSVRTKLPWEESNPFKEDPPSWQFSTPLSLSDIGATDGRKTPRRNTRRSRSQNIWTTVNKGFHSSRTLRWKRTKKNLWESWFSTESGCNLGLWAIDGRFSLFANSTTIIDSHSSYQLLNSLEGS